MAVATPARAEAFETRDAAGDALLDDFLVDRWTVEDGLPLDHLTDLALALDGTLWIATYDGLVRFDGHRFQVLRRATDARLPSNRFTKLVSTPDGFIWAASEDGDLVAIREADGALTVHRARSDLAGAVFGLHQAGGATWASSDQGLLRLEGPNAQPVADSPVGVALDSIGVAADGMRWLGSEDRGLFAQRADAAAIVVIAPSVRAGAMRVLGVDADGVWVGGEGLTRVRWDGKDAVAPLVTQVGAVGGTLSDVCEVVRRPDGVVEARDRHGWWRIDEARATLQIPAEVPRCLVTASSAGAWPWRVAGNRVMRGKVAVFEGRRPLVTLLAAKDGVWVATVGEGLVRLRPRLVHNVAPPAAWKRPSVESVLVSRAGSVWLGSIIEGLWRVEPPWPVPFGMKRPDGQAPGVLGMVETADGGIEVGTDVQRCQVDTAAGCLPVPEGWRGKANEVLNEVLVPLLVDHRGRTWLGGIDTWINGRDSLFVHTLEAGVEGWREVVDALGRSIRDGRAATEGPDGAVYVGTASGGVVRVRDDGVRRVGLAEGLSSERIRSVYVDPRNVLWIGTEDAGLCRWVPSETDDIRCIGLAAGLYDDVVHAILPDDAGRLWFSGNRGISWAQRTTLDAVIEGREASVLAIGLNERHGMANREANGGLPQSATRDAQGRLWFATQAGAVWVDPRAVPLPLPPPVALVSLRVGGGARALLAPGKTLELSSEERSLEIEWTASVLEHNEALRFRYRLAGLEEAWRGPTEERRATWLGLPAEPLVLEIEAGLGGEWGERLRLPIARAPTFSETAWLPLTIALGAVAVGALSMLGWVWRQRRQRVELEREIARRTADLAAANRDLATRSAEVVAQGKRLGEISELRQRFVADLSHELRTPLALVAGPLEDLAAGLLPTLDAAGVRRLDLIRANVARLEVLSDEFLDVARLEAGRLPMRARRHDLGAFVTATAERFRLAFERKALRLELRAASGTVVYFDGDLLDKVVSNLLANALKFTDRGSVTVTLAAGVAGDDGFAKVSVEDTGLGIDANKHGQLFNRFFQVEVGDTRRYEGVGIGLSLVRDLVTLHGGEVSVASTPGVGSMFWFTLPLGAAHLGIDDIDVRPHGEPDLGESPLVSEMEGDDPRPAVLIVEDHPDMRAYLAQHLGERFAVWQADSGITALEAMRTRLPAAIVSDVMMPGMDGLELCRRVRADARLAGVPIVLVSAKAGVDDRVAGLALADDYMTKPVRPGELVARVSRLVSARLAALRAAHRAEASSKKRTTSETVVAALLAARPPDIEAVDDGAAEDDGGLDGPVDAPVLDAVGQRHLERIDQLIATHLADAAFGVIELAAALALSRRQLQREIRRLTGASPSEHLRAARMLTAERLLRTGARDTVAEVAADVGLSPAYFSRLYSTWFGRAPSDDLAGQ